MDAAVAKAQDAPIANGSRKVYDAGVKRFVKWLRGTHPNAVSADAKRKRGERNDKKANKRLNELVAKKSPEEPPVVFENVTLQMFLQFVTTMKKRDGTAPAPSYLMTTRSAFRNMFEDWDRVMPPAWEPVLKKTFKGIKRMAAKGRCCEWGEAFDGQGSSGLFLVSLDVPCVSPVGRPSVTLWPCIHRAQLEPDVQGI